MTVAEPAGAGRAPREKRRGGVFRETAILVIGALVVAVLVRTFLIQAFYIPSSSMENTLRIDDRVLASKLTTNLGGVSRGEVVVFRDPGDWLSVAPVQVDSWRQWIREGLTFVGLLPSDTGDDLVKRVIGVGGDRVQCCDAEGRVTVNGQPLDEGSYLYPGDAPSSEPFDVLVPKGSLWLMGDHRSVSQDSRFHERERAGNGMVPEDQVIGRAFVVVWPFAHWATLPIPETFGPRLDRAAPTP